MPGNKETKLILLVFFASVAWSIWATSRGWHASISDYHGFRQAQTALTSYYMIHGEGSFLNYETPALGAPWSIPFEFPLYQWLVAKASTIFGMPLIDSGRLVAVTFFGLSLLPLWGILYELRVAWPYRLVFLSLLLVSPLYVFWSRAFMIESTAFFFCMAYLFFVARYLRTKKPLDLLLASLFGSVGALVKATTFPGFLLASGLLYVHREREALFSLSSLRARGVLFRHIFAATALALIPLLSAAAWTHHADSLKELNVLARPRMSGNFGHWVYGTLSQRLDVDAWKVELIETSRALAGHPLVVASLFGAMFFMRRDRAMVIVCLILFLFVPLVFTNLHFAHRYYAYANGIFLLAAMGWAIVSLIQEEGIIRRMAGVGLLLLFLAGSTYRFVRSFDRRGIDGRGFKQELVESIQRFTAPEEVIVEFGERTSWSSELPFYSERRAMVWPQRMEKFREDDLKVAVANLESYRVGAVIFERDYRNSEFIDKAVALFDLSAVPAYEDEISVLYLRAD